MKLRKNNSRKCVFSMDIFASKCDKYKENLAKIEHQSFVAKGSKGGIIYGVSLPDSVCILIPLVYPSWIE